MKGFFFLSLVILLPIMASAQSNLPIDAATGKVVYTDVVDINGVSAADLHARLNHWFNTFFENPTGVIQENEAGAKINGKHRFTIFYTDKGKQYKKGHIYYTISVQLKDGKYKYTIDDIFFYQVPKLYIEEWLDPSAPNKEQQFDYLRQVEEFMNTLLADLAKTMKEPVPAAETDDW